MYLVEYGLNNLVWKGGEVIDERLKREDESARRANGGTMAAHLDMI